MSKISVVVLNYNGKKVLRQCLRSVIALAWDDLEIVLVDNASQDGSVADIVAEFGERVRIVQRSINSPTAGRNEGFQNACGDYVLSLDNDIVLPDPLVLQKAAATLERFPNVGALAFMIGGQDNPDLPLSEHWWHPVALKDAQNQCFYTDWFAEGAVLFRRRVLQATGGYDDSLFHGYESVDLALRILEHRFDILYCPHLTSIELRVRGLQSVVRSRINYLTLRNKLWTAWKDYPLLPGLYFGITRCVAAGVCALRYGWPDFWLRAVLDGVLPPPDLRRRRKPISGATWKRIRQIRNGTLRMDRSALIT